MGKDGDGPVPRSSQKDRGVSSLWGHSGPMFWGFWRGPHCPHVPIFKGLDLESAKIARTPSPRMDVALKPTK